MNVVATAPRPTHITPSLPVAGAISIGFFTGRNYITGGRGQGARDSGLGARVGIRDGRRRLGFSRGERSGVSCERVPRSGTATRESQLPPGCRIHTPQSCGRKPSTNVMPSRSASRRAGRKPAFSSAWRSVDASALGPARTARTRGGPRDQGPLGGSPALGRSGAQPAAPRPAGSRARPHPLEAGRSHPRCRRRSCHFPAARSALQLRQPRSARLRQPPPPAATEQPPGCREPHRPAPTVQPCRPVSQTVWGFPSPPAPPAHRGAPRPYPWPTPWDLATDGIGTSLPSLSPPALAPSP